METDKPKIQMAHHCESSEKGMIGCVVRSGGAILDEYELTQDHFLTYAPGEIFKAVVRLRKKEKAIDLFSVQGEMDPDALEKIGACHMSDLCHYPSLSMAETFFTTLCEMLTLRKGLQMALWVETTLLAGKPDIGHFCANAARLANELECQPKSDNVLESAVLQAKERIRRMQAGEKPHRVPTPINAWNAMFGGIADGRYYAIASRPGLGKTAMMEQMLTVYLNLQIPVIIFEKDMSPQLLVERIACREAGVPFWKYDREMLDERECKKVSIMLDGLDPSYLKIFNPTGLTADKMCAIARKEIKRSGARAVFLDHIQCLRFNGKDLREGLTSASLTIRQCVTETNVPHIVLAHINRDGAKGRPAPENIKEFDQLFGDVDALGLLWSEVEAADVENGKPRPMKLYAAKNRGGAVTEEDLLFHGPLLKFINP